MSRKEAAAPILEVKGLKKYFFSDKAFFSRSGSIVRAVDGVDFTVGRGETLGIVGESGCGKSTLGQLIMRLLEPTEGEVWFDGENLAAQSSEELRRSRRNMQIIFQDPFSSLNPRMKVQRIIAEPLQVHEKLAKYELRRRVAQLLETVGLDEYHMGRYPHEFSGGQRQRIGIARALALQPKLIVCDEPVSALDVSIQAQILNLLKQLQQDYGLTYVFIGHGLPAVKHISDRIAVMYLGKIVEIAGRESLFAHYRHPYTEALLSAIPIADPKVRMERIVLKGEPPNPAKPPSGCAFHPRCPYARKECREAAPPLKAYTEDHFFACHYPVSKQ